MRYHVVQDAMQELKSEIKSPSKNRYESWGSFLRSYREKKYRSAREFCARFSIGISYPQYSRYEVGEQLPNLNQALLLCRLLDIYLVEGLFVWSLSQIQDPETHTEINLQLAQLRRKKAENILNPEPEPHASPKTKDHPLSHLTASKNSSPVELDDVFVFNRSHLKLFSSNPIYRDIFTYINSYGPGWLTKEELAKAHEVSTSEMAEFMEQLQQLGIIIIQENKCRALKKILYFPDDPDFFELRNLNITHNATSILKKLTHQEIIEKRAFRGLVTRELTLEQRNTLFTKIDELFQTMLEFPETENPEKIYSLCLLLGGRFSRPS